MTALKIHPRGPAACGIFWLLACALLCALATTPAQAQHKRALLIGGP